MPDMPSVLVKIVAQTRRDLALRRQAVAETSLWSCAQPSDRSLEDALRARRTGYILECKKASPSQGLLREDFDPVMLATTYAPFADAISVLTDAPFFQGSHAYLRAVREAVSVPVLCKDFVVDPYQVVEARTYGADAILLMLSVLDDATYARCAEAAARLGMDVLTEAHDAEEVARAVALGARVIGINNRNLHTLSVDLGVTEALASRVPGDRVLVSESGLGTHADARRLRSISDGFLIGTSLVRAKSSAHALRELVFGRVKVCGLTRPEDARAAWRAGATWGGLIFAPRSPRAVSLERASIVREAAPLRWVGVFVDASVDDMVDRARALSLHAVQLHGQESPALIEALRRRLPNGCEIWKAFRVADELPDQRPAGVSRWLLDTYRPGQPGGTGERFDWSLLGDGMVADMVLAGGLSAALAQEADGLGAWLLDVNSGVEDAPGRKSESKLQAFFAQLRGTSGRGG